MAYQVRVAIDCIRFAIKATDQFAHHPRQLQEAGLQLLDALDRLESAERIAGAFSAKVREWRPRKHIATLERFENQDWPWSDFRYYAFSDLFDTEGPAGERRASERRGRDDNGGLQVHAVGRLARYLG